MSYYILDAGDKLTDKIFIGYDDGSYMVEYVRPEEVEATLATHYGKRNVIYLATQERPLRKTSPVVFKDTTETRIEKLEEEAEPYIYAMSYRQTGPGKRLTGRIRDAKESLKIIYAIRRWTGWETPSGCSIQEYYRRLEHGAYGKWY